MFKGYTPTSFSWTTTITTQPLSISFFPQQTSIQNKCHHTPLHQQTAGKKWVVRPNEPARKAQTILRPWLLTDEPIIEYGTRKNLQEKDRATHRQMHKTLR